jgi:hypothetical protein
MYHSLYDPTRALDEWIMTNPDLDPKMRPVLFSKVSRVINDMLLAKCIIVTDYPSHPAPKTRRLY